MSLIFEMIPWLLSVNTVALTFLVGRKSTLGWMLGVAGQLVWALFIITRSEWGLVPMWVGLTTAYTWNLIKWRRESHETALEDKKDETR